MKNATSVHQLLDDLSYYDIMCNQCATFSSQTLTDRETISIDLSFNTMASVPRAFNQWTKQ